MRQPLSRSLFTLLSFFVVSSSLGMSMLIFMLRVSTQILPFSSLSVSTLTVVWNFFRLMFAQFKRKSAVEPRHSASEAARSARASAPIFSFGTPALLMIRSCMFSLLNLIFRSPFSSLSSSTFTSDFKAMNVTGIGM